jgi:hypothetical protein
MDRLDQDDRARFAVLQNTLAELATREDFRTLRFDHLFNHLVATGNECRCSTSPATGSMSMISTISPAPKRSDE